MADGAFEDEPPLSLSVPEQAFFRSPVEDFCLEFCRRLVASFSSTSYVVVAAAVLRLILPLERLRRFRKMRSSKMNGINGFIVDESKCLSPFTYYQPFRSTFDPGFLLFATTYHDLRNHPQPWTTGWARRFQEQGASRASGARGSVISWVEEPSRWASGCRGQPRGPRPGRNSTFAAFGGAEVDKGSAVGMPPRGPSRPSRRVLSSGPNQNPRHPVREVRGSKYLAIVGKNHGMPSSFPEESKTSFALARNDNSAPGRSDAGVSSVFGNARARPANVSSAFHGTTRNSICHPENLSPFTKNSTESTYKTGHNHFMICNFCKNNREVPDIYLNHYLYDPETKILTCPILRRHVCQICGGTGDHAHTLQYCPVNRKKGLQAKIPVLLKARTITNSTGKIRRN